jgi:hypothetical protein
MIPTKLRYQQKKNITAIPTKENRNVIPTKKACVLVSLDTPFIWNTNSHLCYFFIFNNLLFDFPFCEW